MSLAFGSMQEDERRQSGTTVHCRWHYRLARANKITALSFAAATSNRQADNTDTAASLFFSLLDFHMYIAFTLLAWL
uniref:Uncharacterized protein n=1 Tax=Salix viminalis TaxID=40686 RepID=A0A6N2MMX0_SALVM